MVFEIDNTAQWAKQCCKEVILRHLLSMILAGGVLLAASIPMITFGFVLHNRLLVISGFAFWGIALCLAINCIGVAQSTKRVFYGGRKKPRDTHWRLTIDADVFEIYNATQDTSVRLQKSSITKVVKTKNALLLYTGKQVCAYLPLNPQYENEFGAPTVDDPRKLFTTIGIIVLVFAFVAGGLAINLLLPSKITGEYIPDQLFVELDCQIQQIEIESGILYITANILTDNHKLQPIDGKYRFAVISDGALSMGLDVGDAVTIKCLESRDKKTDAYLIAYLAKGETVYLDYATGKHDVWSWRLKK